MPTPLDLLMDPITLTMLAMFAALALAEHLFPGRPLPRVPGWQSRALAVFAIYVLLSSYLPLLWADALAPMQLFDLSGWPTWAAATLGLLVYELFAYAYHRAGWAASCNVRRATRSTMRAASTRRTMPTCR